MAQRYDWEDSSDAEDGRHAWERDSADSSMGSDADNNPNSLDFAASEFLEVLPDLYHSNTIVTAEKVCVLCQWAAKGFPNEKLHHAIWQGARSW